MVESLHQCDQGVFYHMVQSLKEKLNNKQLQILGTRMSIVSNEFSISHFRLPGEAFWTTDTNIQGHEYRSVMQVSSLYINLNI